MALQALRRELATDVEINDPNLAAGGLRRCGDVFVFIDDDSGLVRCDRKRKTDLEARRQDWDR